MCIRDRDNKVREGKTENILLKEQRDKLVKETVQKDKTIEEKDFDIKKKDKIIDDSDILIANQSDYQNTLLSKLEG